MMRSSTLNKPSMKITFLTLSMLTSIACSSNRDEGVPVEIEHTVTGGKETSVVTEMTPRKQIDFSKQDLATRLGLEADMIKVSGATSVHWRSGALGCPKPGMSYTDALVPGVWIVLQVNNRAYRYHAIPFGQPFYCPDERAEAPATTPGLD